jgi:hypothetical protein
LRWRRDMRSEEECRAKATEMTQRARSATTPDEEGEWSALAKTWRWLAHQAGWQDRYHAPKNAQKVR